MTSLIALSFIEDIHGNVPKPSIVLPHIIRQKNKKRNITLNARLIGYDMKTNVFRLKVDMNEPHFHIEIPIDCKLLYKSKKEKRPLVLKDVDGFLFGKANGKIQFVSLSICDDNFDNKIIIKITDSLYVQFFVEVTIRRSHLKLWIREWVQMSLLCNIPC